MRGRGASPSRLLALERGCLPPPSLAREKRESRLHALVKVQTSPGRSTAPLESFRRFQISAKHVDVSQLSIPYCMNPVNVSLGLKAMETV